MKQRNKRYYLTLVCLLLLGAISPLSLQAQEGSSYLQRKLDQLGKWVAGTPWEYDGALRTTHTKHLGSFSWEGMKDEYLSPITHTGYALGWHTLTDYPTPKGAKHHWYMESALSFGRLLNPANKSALFSLSGRIEVGPSWRILRLKPGFTLDIAPMAELKMSGNYKSGNSNNMANAKVSAGINGWLRAKYTIPWRVMPLALSYSVQSTLLGGAFHPDFGQSYYDYISGHNRIMPKVHFTFYHNSRDVRQRFLVDIPIQNITLTLGAEHYYKSEILSHTRFTHGYWNIVVGVSLDSFKISGGKSHTPALKSSYYD